MDREGEESLLQSSETHALYNTNDIIFDETYTYRSRLTGLKSFCWRRLPYIIIVVVVAIAIVVAGVLAYVLTRSDSSSSPNDPSYQFDVVHDNLQMKDGTNLSVTFVLPRPKQANERFPVLFEYLPYRKDDSFLMRDWPYFSYFGSRGFAIAKVDIRGTGSSQGKLIPFEYTDEELDDGVEIIDQLSKKSWSNGNIGMFGISWGAFNSLMMATYRKPPALKAIYVLHGSHDLYELDIHYTDGILHYDDYILSVDHENALPRTPHYPLDAQWVSDRFNTTPWTQVYLSHQLDSEFWKHHSIMYNWSNIAIPVYLIGGYYDLYTDFAPKIYQAIKDRVPKAKLVVGPWDHSWPENGSPGPNYDGKAEAVRWFNQWLKPSSVASDLDSEPEVTFYVRDSYPPGASVAPVPGGWRYESWPIARMTPTAFYLSANHTLSSNKPNGLSARELEMQYLPSTGFRTVAWWTQITDNQYPLDENNATLVFQAPPFAQATTIIGFVNVSLVVAANATRADWFIKLEDYDSAFPSNVTIITGIALNSAFHLSRDNPQPLTPWQLINITGEMHFTSWRFLPGHGVRIAISNSAPRMGWPSPTPQMSTIVSVDNPNSFIQLPIIPDSETPPVVPEFTKIPYDPPKQKCDYGFYYTDEFSGSETYGSTIANGINSATSSSLGLANQGEWYYLAGEPLVQNAYGNLVAAYIAQNMTLNTDNQPEFFSWNGYAVQLIARNISLVNTSDSVKQTIAKKRVYYWADVFSKGGAELPVALVDTSNTNGTKELSDNLVMGWFELRTQLVVSSNATTFTCTIDRRLLVNGTLPLQHFTLTQYYPRTFQ